MEQTEMNDKKTYVYDASAIFEDIKDDPDNVLMNIPEEISEKMGWKPGDLLKIRVYEDSKQIAISKVEPTDNTNE